MFSLEKFVQKLREDERNKAYTERGILPVFQSSTRARILIIGQAPGKKVEKTGIPFNDKSGERLMDWMGVTRKEFYSDDIAIMPMDFYYPGKAKTGDLPPRAFIAKEYHKELLDSMPYIRLTILIGWYSVRYYLKGKEKENLTRTVKAFRDYLPEYFPIPHPSPLNNIWLKKNSWFLEEVVPELQKRVRLVLGE